MKSFIRALRLPTSSMLAFLLLSASWSQATECFVLSAGVDNYPRENKLQGCVNDARNTTAAFSTQSGKLFSKVYADTLVDGQATHAALLQKMEVLSRVGTAGDYVVIFLSGHGGRTADQRSWFFLPHDYDSQRHAATALTDRQILDAAEVLVQRNKKVFVIIDACFAGQLNVSAQPYFQKHRNPQGGGLVLMLSSAANQTSTALGQYSAFAKAFAESMTEGDLNRDGKITIDEIRRDSFQRTHNLIKQRGISAKQDSEIHWSPSINGTMPLALLNGNGGGMQPQPPGQSSRTWVGNETLQDFGQLAFHMYRGGRVVMHDTAGTSEGMFEMSGSQVTLRFSNGRVIYTGTLQGNTISGTARNERTSWTFTVSEGAAQPQPQPQPVTRIWTGTESLPGFGNLAFHMIDGGRAVMHDTTGVSEGTFEVSGDQVTLRFSNGHVVYTGTLQGNTISGEARNDRTNWTFRVNHAPTTAQVR